ncbi:hypothetical protein [uncultured Aquimarina sp.]|uniref:hypothetical protein n=1 Tax=uncultured Aquimarina sp. TaxID=575652 RepID=UPI00260163BA|nr:hypothetical protein [uncultured Aquimarina sp.]
MKNINKQKLSIEKIKVARLNNPINIVGGSFTLPTTTSLQCPTTIPETVNCGDQSTKTAALGSSIIDLGD